MVKNDNTLALCIIIIVVVGLFLYYEMGYKFEYFKLGGQHHRQHHGNHGNHGYHRYPYYGRRFKDSPWHHRYYHAIFPTEHHPINVRLEKDKLFDTYDLDSSGMIERNEWSIALDGDLKNKMNDNNIYSFK